MLRYRKQVLKEVQHWHERGWIDEQGVTQISADLAARGSRFGTAGALATLGAVLIGFAAMSFVAANWQEMSRLARLALLFAGLAGAYGAAGYLAQRGLDVFANAATLVGVAIFGASIMLIAQMFHIEGNPPDAVLMWAAGTLLAGVALSSTSALGLAMPLIMLWGAWEQGQQSDVFWLFLAGWAVVTAAYVWLRWRPGLHLSAIALSGFVVSLGATLWSPGSAFEVVAIIGLLAVAGAFVLHQLVPEMLRDEVLAGAGYALATAFVGLFALQFFEKTSLTELILLASFTLALMLGVIYWSIRNEQKHALWLGYVGFSIEVLALYFKTFETLLGSSLFFLVAGVLVLALAGAAYKLHARNDQLEVA